MDGTTADSRPQTLYLHRVLQHWDFLLVRRPKLTPGGREAQSDGHGQLQVHDGHAHDGDPVGRQAAQGLAEALPHVLREESRWRWTRDPRATSGMGAGVEGCACPPSTLQAQPLGHPRHSPPGAEWGGGRYVHHGTVRGTPTHRRKGPRADRHHRGPDAALPRARLEARAGNTAGANVLFVKRAPAPLPRGSCLPGEPPSQGL